MAKDNKFTNKAVWLICAFIFLSAIVLVTKFSPYIPDYDGLVYFDVAKTMNGWLFLPSDYHIFNEQGKSIVSYWPISNALSVFVAAIFYHTIDINILPSFINTLYLCLFVTYLVRLRSSSYACMAILLLCSHTLFFRLFTTLTTEFSVGLWIFSFLLTLESEHKQRGLYLAALTILGLLLRTIDVVFILMSGTAYVVIHYTLWRDRRHVLETIRYIGYSLLLTSPLFFQHYKAAFSYVYEVSFGFTAASWKSLGGVADRSDVIQQYGKFLFFYNKFVIPITIFVVVFSFFTKAVSKKNIILVVGIATAVCLPLLMASSLNIQVVFWVFSSLVFMVCELTYLIYNNYAEKTINSFFGLFFIKNIGLSVIFFGFIFSLAISWNVEVPYLRNQSEISKIAFDISSVINKAPSVPTIATNYRGVGAIDMIGLAWGRADRFNYGGIYDIYSKNKNPSDYLKLSDSTNFFIAAHDNYYFPPHFGINDHINETRQLFSETSSELGFRNIRTISRSARDFDIWYRPGAYAYLQFSAFEDNWISHKLPVEIGEKSLCAENNVIGKLIFHLDFPNPGVPGYTPPFLIKFGNKYSDRVNYSTSVNKYGNADVVFELKDLPCAMYELTIDKTFSTKLDPRNLSANFISLESQLRFISSKSGAF